MLRISILLILLGLNYASAEASRNLTEKVENHFYRFFYAVKWNDTETMVLMVNDKNRQHLEPFMALFENVKYEIIFFKLLENGSIEAHLVLTNESTGDQKFVTFFLIEDWISPTDFKVNAISLIPITKKYQRKGEGDFGHPIMCSINILLCAVHIFGSLFG